jgi:DNA-binding HxlR family transcriptional regulator
MRHKSSSDMPSPIARSLERVGEWWSILILAEALRGLARFDQFRESLGISPNMLARRLNAVVATGLLERRPYSDYSVLWGCSPGATGISLGKARPS